MTGEPHNPAEDAPERPEVTPAVAVLPPSWGELLTHADAKIDAWFDPLRGNPVSDRIFYKASEVGDYSLIWHVIGLVRGQQSARHASNAIRLSVVLGLESALVNGLIKSAFRRTRPRHETSRPHRLRTPKTSSFPSGHASAAFTAAGVLAESSRAWPAFYAAAAVVASSRVYVKIHHPSDVIVGSALGLALGRVARRAWPLR